MPRLAPFLPLSPLYQHFNTVSPQLFTLISQTILLVVYYFYHLLPLSKSFANCKHFSSLHWHLDKHWLIWKVLQYTDKYTYLGKCEYHCKDISLLFGFWRIHLLLLFMYMIMFRNRFLSWLYFYQIRSACSKKLWKNMMISFMFWNTMVCSGHIIIHIQKKIIWLWYPTKNKYLALILSKKIYLAFIWT